jgi:peptidoglycan hydrolase CwlO-like protein
MKYLSLLLSVIACFIIFGASAQPTYSDVLDDIKKELNDLTRALDMSINATKPLESQLNALKSQIAEIKDTVTAIEQDVATKKKNIDDGYKNLAKQQSILETAISDYYIKSYYSSPLLTLLSIGSASEITQVLAYQRAAADQDKAIIANIAVTLDDLETKKANLEYEQSRLIALKTTLDEQSGKLDEVVKGAKAYQSTLTSKIADLSAKQQQIVNERSGSFTASIGNSELADDYNASIIGFREAAPSGSFAIFSFGAYTHRKGMSQYGARGRAQAGQDYRAILRAYYGKDPVGKDTGGSIRVSGHGEMDFEGRYLLGIAEMPSSWHSEALKAQAVAARTYAYRFKLQGSEICTTEACQVFSSSKADSSPQAWKDAVEATRGQVIEDVVTYYASTHGGFTTTSGWDTNDGGGGSNFIDKSWDKAGGSPWLYKAWYRKGYTNSGDTCGKSNPWLSSEEMADIINAGIIPRDDRITPITTSCWGGNPYSMQELRDKGGVSSVSGVSVSQGNGVTNEVIFQTNKGEVRMSGSQFRNAVALRAPGYIRIPQGEYGNGWTFFNIEKK